MTPSAMPQLPARLTHQEAPECVRQLTQALAQAKGGDAGQHSAWPIDAAALTHFDSSALAVLLECRRLADADGRQVRIVNAPAKLGQLARLYGVEDLLDLGEQGGAAQEPL